MGNNLHGSLCFPHLILSRIISLVSSHLIVYDINAMKVAQTKIHSFIDIIIDCNHDYVAPIDASPAECLPWIRSVPRSGPCWGCGPVTPCKTSQPATPQHITSRLKDTLHPSVALEVSYLINDGRLIL